MPHVITLTGPSGAGKSTLISQLLLLKTPYFRPVVLSKFNTREPRTENGVKATGNTSYCEAICVKQLPPNCDLVYEQYGTRYGLPMETIYDALIKGNSPIVILNDVRTVQDVRTTLGKLVRSIFLFRESPSLDKHTQLAKQRGVQNEAEAATRFQKAQSIYRIYIENIFLFDHVMLNFGSVGDLEKQATILVEGLSGKAEEWPLK